MSEVIRSNTIWNGKSEIKVGDNLQYSINGLNWFLGEVRYIVRGKENKSRYPNLVVYCPHLNYEQVLNLSNDENRVSIQSLVPDRTFLIREVTQLIFKHSNYYSRKLAEELVDMVGNKMK